MRKKEEKVVVTEMVLSEGEAAKLCAVGVGVEVVAEVVAILVTQI